MDYSNGIKVSSVVQPSGAVYPSWSAIGSTKMLFSLVFVESHTVLDSLNGYASEIRVSSGIDDSGQTQNSFVMKVSRCVLASVQLMTSGVPELSSELIISRFAKSRYISNSYTFTFSPGMKSSEVPVDSILIAISGDIPASTEITASSVLSDSRTLKNSDINENSNRANISIVVAKSNNLEESTIHLSSMKINISHCLPESDVLSSCTALPMTIVFGNSQQLFFFSDDHSSSDRVAESQSYYPTELYQEIIITESSLFSQSTIRLSILNHTSSFTSTNEPHLASLGLLFLTRNFTQTHTHSFSGTIPESPRLYQSDRFTHTSGLSMSLPGKIRQNDQESAEDTLSGEFAGIALGVVAILIVIVVLVWHLKVQSRRESNRKSEECLEVDVETGYATGIDDDSLDFSVDAIRKFESFGGVGFLWNDEHLGAEESFL
jgi:hypothetical protein